MGDQMTFGRNSRTPRRPVVPASMATAVLVIGGGATRSSAAPASVTAAIVNSTLQVTGTDGADQVALRRRATDPTVLEVDAGNDGSADFLFPRSAVTSIVVDLGGGSDLARIDQSGGVFTDTTPTTLNGGVTSCV
jgi:hypothetical protein